MTSHDADVRALRAALLPAIERDLARPKRRRRLAVSLSIGALALAGAGTAAATGVIFAAPKVSGDVPVVPEWQYYKGNPYGQPGGPAVLMRLKPEAVAHTNALMEAALAKQGVTARCGSDAGHPLACFLPSGDLVPGPAAGAAMQTLDPHDIADMAPENYDIRELTPAEAHRFLCDHPTQRPGADGGEKPAPTQGYEDC